MTLLQERPDRSETAATIRPADGPAGPPPGPAPSDDWRWVPDPAETEPPPRPAGNDRLLLIYAWARTIGF